MFECDKCGLCCMNLNLNPLYKELDRGDGICKYFNEETHLCQIYNHRPIVCNVDTMYELYFSEQMSRSEYYKLNKSSCEKLRKKE